MKLVVTEFQQKTEDLFSAFFADEKNWSSYRQMIKNVFVANYSLSLAQENIELTCKGLFGLPMDGDVSDALKVLTKAKVLRSRMVRGVRRWEVNY